CAGASTGRCPARTRDPRIASTRSATSVAGVVAPTHTSYRGSCSRVVGDHTTGIPYSLIASGSHHEPGLGQDDGMPRARDLGIRVGALPPGPTNSVLDVPGVGLGHATVVRDEPPPPEGRGVARTGVTTLLLAEDAFDRPLAAGGAVLNGAG